MVITKHTYNEYQSENIVLNGKNKSGSQTYKCNDCDICQVLFGVKKTKDIDLNTLNKTYQERNSTRSTERIFGITHVTVWNYLKKSSKFIEPPMQLILRLR